MNDLKKCPHLGQKLPSRQRGDGFRLVPEAASSETSGRQRLIAARLVKASFSAFA